MPRYLRILTALAACCLPGFGAISISNSSLERRFATDGGRLRTTAILNKLDHRLYKTESEEFALKFVWERLQYEHGTENPVTLTAADFTLRDTQPAPRRVAFLLENRRYGLEVKVVYSLEPEDFYLRKWLEIRSTGKAPVFLDEVWVENLTLPGVTPRLGGFGQPVYADGLFLGLEYPAGVNSAGGHGRIGLSYHPGEVTGDRVYSTERAVLGVAAEGSIRTAFQKYISRIRSGPVRPVIVFNTWYDMQGDGLTAENSIERMRLLKTNLLDPFGIRLSSFVLDDGWDDRDNVWTIHPGRFPGGFTELNQNLRAQGTSLGLWFGPIGGYDERARRLASGRRQGYEITANGQYLCLAGRVYRQRFKSTVLDLVKRYRVNHLKFDGVPYGCNAPDHGHLPGIYSREAHARAFIDILKSVRAADPDVFLNITTGQWLSPWWLQYADVVFMGGLDYGFSDAVPSVSERDKAITYRDQVLYDDFRRYEYQFPHNSLMTIGIIKGTLGGEGGLGESERNWVDNAVMNFSRGSMMTELYVSPRILTRREWQTLGEVIRWADQNKDVLLADAHFVLGDPSKREIYGYAHFAGRGIVTLRNPYIEPRTAELKLDDAAGAPREGRLRARIVYPYTEQLAGSFGFGDTVRVPVEGYQVLVLEFAPAGAAESAPQAARVPGVRTGSFRIDPAPGGGGVEGSAELSLPQDVENARLAILYEAPDRGEPPLASFRVNGRQVKARAVGPHSTEKGLGYGEGRWVIFLLPLGIGQNRLEFTLERSAPLNGTVSAWVLGDFLRTGGPAGPALPFSSNRASRTLHLFTRQLALKQTTP
jgi:hypothetical protein